MKTIYRAQAFGADGKIRGSGKLAYSISETVNELVELMRGHKEYMSIVVKGSYARHIDDILMGDVPMWWVEEIVA